MAVSVRHEFVQRLESLRASGEYKKCVQLFTDSIGLDLIENLTDEQLLDVEIMSVVRIQFGCYLALFRDASKVSSYHFDLLRRVAKLEFRIVKLVFQNNIEKDSQGNEYNFLMELVRDLYTYLVLMNKLWGVPSGVEIGRLETAILNYLNKHFYGSSIYHLFRVEFVLRRKQYALLPEAFKQAFEYELSVYNFDRAKAILKKCTRKILQDHEYSRLDVFYEVAKHHFGLVFAIKLVCSSVILDIFASLRFRMLKDDIESRMPVVETGSFVDLFIKLYGLLLD